MNGIVVVVVFVVVVVAVVVVVVVSPIRNDINKCNQQPQPNMF